MVLEMAKRGYAVSEDEKRKRLAELRTLFESLLAKIREDGLTVTGQRHGVAVIYPHPLLKQLPALSKEISRLEDEIGIEDLTDLTRAVDPDVLAGSRARTLSEKRSRAKSQNAR